MNMFNIRGSNISWPVIGLALLTIASGVFVGISISALLKNGSYERVWMSLSNTIQVQSQKLSNAAGEAALGNLDAFNQLERTHRLIDANIRALGNRDSSSDLPPLPAETTGEFTTLSNSWKSISSNAQVIIDSEALVNELADASVTFLQLSAAIQARADQVVRQLIESGAPNPQVFAASRQLILADRMLSRVTDILQSAGGAENAASELRGEMALFEQVQNALRRGSQRLGVTPIINQQALRSQADVRRLYAEATPQLEIILEASVNLNDVRNAADAIYLDSERLFSEASALTSAIDSLPTTRAWPSVKSTTMSLGLLILSTAALVGFAIFGARRRADTAFRSNRRTQQAIVRLLDELSCLADGDLTTRATVTDDVTGAIADAVNFAIEQLRDLVMDINQTAGAVAESAEYTRVTTSNLAQSANEQAGQVARATEKIQAMSMAFGTMAERSKESSETARDSVGIAHNGARKVRETITGMDTIREQIQETSKRIKRLGESTQEIGDIVSLINDIAEQTNVLALNAAIQAASAGGSGQGFGVVADEVQQLAESATNATRRISGLVQTIQADTSEAVKSMESTTTEVVNGARLARDAGVALVQTEKASTELSNLIADISREAQTHSDQARMISELMDGIRAISVKSSKGTSLTAGSVAELAELVMQLQSSVEDFKLPPQERSLEEIQATPTIDFEEEASEPPITGGEDDPAESWPEHQHADSGKG